MRRAAYAEPTAPAERAGRRSCRSPPDRGPRVRRAPPRPADAAGAGIEEFIKKQRAMGARGIEHGLSASAHRGRAAQRRERHPERSAAALDQGDRRRPTGAWRVAPCRWRRRAASVAPRCAPGQTLRVQPRWLVPLNSRRKDLGLPCVRRCLEPFKRGQDRRQRIGPFKRVSSVTWCHANRNRRKSRAATGSISERRR